MPERNPFEETATAGRRPGYSQPDTRFGGNLERANTRREDPPRWASDRRDTSSQSFPSDRNVGGKGPLPVLENLGLDNVKELVKNAKPLIGEGKVPNYPFKDDWYNTGLKELLFDAIRDGKDALSISTSAAMKSRYTDRYHKFYESLYDQKIPSAMKKLAKKYGGEFRKGRLDMSDTFQTSAGRGFGYSDLEIENAKSNIIKITPKMREKIIAEGLPSFGYRSGGMVDKAITGGSRYI